MVIIEYYIEVDTADSVAAFRCSQTVRIKLAANASVGRDIWQPDFRRSNSAFDRRSQLVLRRPQVGPLHERGQFVSMRSSAFRVHSSDSLANDVTSLYTYLFIIQNDVTNVRVDLCTEFTGTRRGLSTTVPSDGQRALSCYSSCLM